MSKRSSIGSFHDRSHVMIKATFRAYKKSKYAKKRVKMIGGGYRGSRKEYRETVQSYWSCYGVKPKRYWYALYCNGQGAYDPRYVPDSMWYRRILPYFNNLTMRRAYTDKGMYNRLFTEVRKPETVVKNIAGYYYNGDGEKLITREEAQRLCEQETHLIFKPSLDSGGGREITFYDRDKEGTPSISSIFDDFGVGFVAQRLVRQHPDLARINKESLNTVRVMSFHFNGSINILSAQLRMGNSGSRVDNISAGGCACAIKPDGWLSERAVTRKSVWTDAHDSGLKFRDIRVPSYDKIVEKVTLLHSGLPYFNLIGWDFAVDEQGEPVLIEFNVMPEQNQIGSGKPTFGDLSDEVFEDVFVKKSLKDAFE